MTTIDPADFPILDAARQGADQPGGRAIMDVFGVIEPHIAELDFWCAMPVRLVYSQIGGWGIELGPYTLNASDIERLRDAIAAYDDATGGPH
jgi:hypothetical protein